MKILSIDSSAIAASIAICEDEKLDIARELIAKAELNGVTLESLVVAERVARAIKTAAKNGRINIEEFPLLLHVDEIITQKLPVNIPWEEFTFCN